MVSGITTSKVKDQKQKSQSNSMDSNDSKHHEYSDGAELTYREDDMRGKRHFAEIGLH
jgi:hypothetical protein